MGVRLRHREVDLDMLNRIEFRLAETVLGLPGKDLVEVEQRRAGSMYGEIVVDMSS